MIFSKDGCPPCGTLMEALPDLQADFEITWSVVKLDDSKDVFARYGVSKTPTTLVFQDAREVGRVEGAAVDKIVKILRAAVRASSLLIGDSDF